MKTCSNCELPILGEPQPYENHEPVYYKRNGYVGTTFIPYEKRVRTVNIRKTWLRLKRVSPGNSKVKPCRMQIKLRARLKWSRL